MELLTIADAARALDVPVTRVHQYARDGALLIHDGGVPADLIQDGAPVKSLPAVVTLLRDARYTDAEIVDWLYRADSSLPGAPIRALRENRGSEVKRRAQAAGY